MIIPNRAQDMGADSGQLSVQIHGSDGVKNRTSAPKWVGNRIGELSIGGTEAEI